MGTLTLPASGTVFVDTQAVIYSVEKHTVYNPLLRPLWEAVQEGRLQAATSELTVHEVLVGPLKKNDAALEAAYELFFTLPGIRLFPVTLQVLRDAAKLRAAVNLRAPDAIQAATAIAEKCVLLVHNDRHLRRVSGIAQVFLDDLCAAPPGTETP